MNFEETKIPQNQPEAASEKDVFQEALNNELIKMEEAGEILPEQAEEKRKAATLIETGFSDDPKHDALLFSRVGIADEKELLELFKRK